MSYSDGDADNAQSGYFGDPWSETLASAEARQRLTNKNDDVTTTSTGLTVVTRERCWQPRLPERHLTPSTTRTRRPRQTPPLPGGKRRRGSGRRPPKPPELPTALSQTTQHGGWLLSAEAANLLLL